MRPGLRSIIAFPDCPCLPVGWCILIEHLARGSPPGWFSAVKDRHVGDALRLIHGSPTQDWTLETLAREVGLSRSALAKRFHLYIGEPPIEYLGRWRMQFAANLLDEGTNIAGTAAQVGYKSEAAFNRMFKRFLGVPPGAWRRARRRDSLSNGCAGHVAPSSPLKRRAYWILDRNCRFAVLSRITTLKPRSICRFFGLLPEPRTISSMISAARCAIS
jgi:AraC-like DNA-binding protein